MVAEAQSGDTILITRDNEPVAQLGPVRFNPVHRGKAVGTRQLRPAIARGTKGRYLAVLIDDRAV
jgi:antitoxin (DNA-binding transcriptional repressor) of toxin-antitoxin stability system